MDSLRKCTDNQFNKGYPLPCNNFIFVFAKVLIISWTFNPYRCFFVWKGLFRRWIISKRPTGLSTNQSYQPCVYLCDSPSVTTLTMGLHPTGRLQVQNITLIVLLVWTFLLQSLLVATTNSTVSLRNWNGSWNEVQRHGRGSLTIHVLPPLCPQYSEKSENILSFKVGSGADVDFN